MRLLNASRNVSQRISPAKSLPEHGPGTPPIRPFDHGGLPWAQRLPMCLLPSNHVVLFDSGLQSETIRNHAGMNRYAASACVKPTPHRRRPTFEKLTLVRFLTRRQSNGSTASGIDLEVATSTKPP